MSALSTPLFQKGKADPQVPMPAVLGTVPGQPGPCPYLESPRTLSHSPSSPAGCRLGHLATGTCPDCSHPVSERAVLRRGAGAAAAALHGHAGDGADPEVRLQRQVHIPGRLAAWLPTTQQRAEGQPPLLPDRCCSGARAHPVIYARASPPGTAGSLRRRRAAFLRRGVRAPAKP